MSGMAGERLRETHKRRVPGKSRFGSETGGLPIFSLQPEPADLALPGGKRSALVWDDADDSCQGTVEWSSAEFAFLVH